MTRRIDTFIPEIAPYVIWNGAFNDEEIEAIIEAGELEEFSKGLVGNNELVEDIRDNEITWIQPRDEQKWIFERMNQVVAKVNFDKFQLDLERFDGFQYSKYGQDNFYDWHCDVNRAPPNGIFRKLTVVLLLSDVKDFEGGEFLLNYKGHPDTAEPISLVKGDMLFFYSHTPHKVTPVTKGERITLVTWCLGPKIK